jgi:hypothetical protein
MGFRRRVYFCSRGLLILRSVPLSAGQLFRSGKSCRWLRDQRVGAPATRGGLHTSASCAQAASDLTGSRQDLGGFGDSQPLPRAWSARTPPEISPADPRAGLAAWFARRRTWFVLLRTPVGSRGGRLLPGPSAYRRARRALQPQVGHVDTHGVTVECQRITSRRVIPFLDLVDFDLVGFDGSSGWRVAALAPWSGRRGIHRIRGIMSAPAFPRFPWFVRALPGG